jgi:hypothetical protein
MDSSLDATLGVLASYVVEGLRSAMPPGIKLSAQGRFIYASGEPEYPVAGLTYLDGYPRDETLRNAAESALDDLQDGLAHLTTDPWPTDHAGKVAMPFAEIHGSEIVWGYGPARQPVVSLPRIALSALDGGRDDAA